MLKIIKGLKLFVVAAAIAFIFSPNSTASNMPVSFADLSPELVHEILKRLPRQDKLSCMKVSKNWGFHARDKTLWKGEQFKSENAPKAPIPDFVRDIAFKECNELTDESMKYLAGYRCNIDFVGCNNLINVRGLEADMIGFLQCLKLRSINCVCYRRIDFCVCNELTDIICGAPLILLDTTALKSFDNLIGEHTEYDSCNGFDLRLMLASSALDPSNVTDPIVIRYGSDFPYTYKYIINPKKPAETLDVTDPAAIFRLNKLKFDDGKTPVHLADINPVSKDIKSKGGVTNFYMVCPEYADSLMKSAKAAGRDLKIRL